MKIKTQNLLLVLTIAAIITVFSFPAQATDVGGIIDVDTTWTLANSPYTITSEVEIAEEATLTIEPGVVVNGAGIWQDIKLWGTLIAIGNQTSKIIFNSVFIYGVEVANQVSQLNVQYAEFNIIEGGGQSGLPRGKFQSFILRDSKAKNTSGSGQSWGLSYPTGDCFIERNVFENIMVMTLNITNPTIYIRNNSFFHYHGGAIAVDLNSASSNIVLEYNSFLSTDMIAIRLEEGRDAHLDASNNYWNTTDTNVIDKMIWDRNDTLECIDYVNYLPILTEPHPDTPFLIIISSPNGGEQLTAGGSHEITWTSEGNIENVKIEYSINNGSDWTEIVASTENDGSYPWKVPCDTSDECLIRISDVDGYPSDESDAVFSVIIPEKPIPFSPADGETIATLTPTFLWSAFPGCDGNTQAGYHLRVRCEDCDPNGDTTAYDTGFIADTSSNRHTYSPGAYSGVDPVTGIARVSDPLVCDKHYHWHVRYLDSAGNWSDWSGSPAPYQDFYVAPIACSMTQQTWYVDRNMAYSGNGTEWSRAFKTIQEGIDAAVSERNDIVIVADGTYTGFGNLNLDFGGKEITVRSKNGPNNCIIHGGTYAGFYFHNGEGENSVLEGFTIADFYGRAIYCENSSPTINNCIFSDNGDEYDSSAIFNSGPSTIVTNCKFSDNDACTDYSCTEGGAIYNTGGLTVTGSTFIANSSMSGGGAIRNTGNLIVTNCSFLNNGAGDHSYHGYGGGAICNTGSLTVSNSTFTENVTEYVGGAISTYSLGASATISNSTFLNNHAGYGSGGGAIWSDDSLTTITNCIFAGNKARFNGAILANNSTITNCTFVGNHAHDNEEISGGAISASNSTITNCILWGNKSPDGSQIVGDASTTVNYCDIEGGYPGEGNIDADPMFVDPGYWDDNGTPEDPWDDFFVVGDYHLLADSPCIDAGASIISIGETPGGVAYAQAPPHDDIDGDSRPRDNGYDIGADEYPGEDFWTDDRMKNAIPPNIGRIIPEPWEEQSMPEESEWPEYVNPSFAPGSLSQPVTD